MRRILPLWVEQLENMDDFGFWWKIVQRLIVGVLYGDVSHRLNVPKCDHSFTGNRSPEWHANIVEYFQKIVQKPDACSRARDCDFAQNLYNTWYQATNDNQRHRKICRQMF